MTYKSISEISSVEKLNSNDLILLSRLENSQYNSYSSTLASLISKSVQFDTWEFTLEDKTTKVYKDVAIQNS